jgi:hypothetical protein
MINGDLKSKFCNTALMANIFDGKRLELIGVKFTEREKQEMEKIAAIEDRSLSYVVRELALRGYTLYLQDDEYRLSQEESETARRLLTERGGNVQMMDKPKMVSVETLTPKAKTPKRKIG